ncbi:MAG: cytochrome b [candidate division KSB1 bacterium]|nr:cytochrome b [candidate division KSB1 bacterium]
MSRKTSLPVSWVVFLLIGSVPAFAISNQECLECHSDSTLVKTTEDGRELSLFVDEKRFGESVHGALGCVDCHSDITEIPHPEELARVQCGNCHSEVEEEYLASYHGLSLLKGVKDAPSCHDCHGNHYVRTTDDPESMVYPANLPQTCAICHANLEIARNYHISIPNPYDAYKSSIHFKAVKESGNTASATCSNCHGSHTLWPSSDSRALTYRYNIPKTCSSCHDEIYKEFMASIHGVSVSAGGTDSPVCTDCHGEHNIQAPENPTSTVYPLTISRTTCARCHADERILAKYNLTSGIVKSYLESYHGLASRGGRTDVANCASCHTAHNIRRATDPGSSTHKANLAQTCGNCHPGVSPKVAVGSIHLLPSPQRDKPIYYITFFYISLIAVVIGGMVFHNALDFFKKVRLRYKGLEEPHLDEFMEGQFVRLTLNERIQHFLLMTSFFILVVTGFALKFPEAWWVKPLMKLGGENYELLRGVLHRIAATIFIGLAVYHLFFILFSKRGKEQIRAFLPTLKDLRDVIQMFNYYLGLSKLKARFAHFSYIEKAEYWALIWGTVVMTVTGLILWFENLTMKIFPVWVLDVATVIHYYEAILATVAILVWHFYFMFFNPDVYPMNFACITGKISEEEMMREHPLEYEELALKKALEMSESQREK